MPENLVACIGCGALVPDVDGPTHRYLGASPGCWAVYGEVLAKEFGEFGYPDEHRLSVDAYAVQHPGVPSRQTIQSVAVHLVGLYLVLECGLPAAAATDGLRRVLQHRQQFFWLEPPPSLGAMTVLDVVGALDRAEHLARVRRWAEPAWAAWAPYHATVRRWAGMGR